MTPMCAAGGHMRARRCSAVRTSARSLRLVIAVHYRGGRKWQVNADIWGIAENEDLFLGKECGVRGFDVVAHDLRTRDLLEKWLRRIAGK